MSKLADKIRKVTRVESQPIGFGTSRASSSATMLIAGVARDAASAAEMARRGADIVIIGAADAAAPAAGANGAAGAPVGGWIAGRADNEAKSYREGGYDFVIFDPGTASATALLDEEIGYVLSSPGDLTDNELRTIEAFQLDAIDVGAISGSLTVRRQIDLRRIFSLTRKPMMAAVDAGISVTELQALRDANVIVVTAESADGVERLRKTVDALPPRARRKDGDDRPTPLVPRASFTEEADDEEHEHEGA